MRTFVIRARNGTTRPELVKSQIGTKGHLEIVAHSIMNAFFLSDRFREDVEVFIILESTADYPKTIRLCSIEGLSFAGFHEEAILDVIVEALIQGQILQKDETRKVSPGVEISAFGFEKLIQSLLLTRTVYLLDKKGSPIQNIQMPENPVFILSDHLVMPKNSVKAFKKQGVIPLSFGKTMLFASQCITIIHYELDK